MQDFGTKSDNTAGASGQLSAAEFNNLTAENENAVLRSGQALIGGSESQLAASLFIHAVKSQLFQDSGSANTYVATPISGVGGVLLPADFAPLNGMIVVFQASAANTGASTLNIGQSTGTLLGAKPIVKQGGAALVAGAIGSGTYINLRYDSGLDKWVLFPWCSAATESELGLAKISTAAESQGWTAGTVITALRLATAFKGSNQQLAVNGFQKFPGGLHLITGAVTVTGGAFSTFNFPITLPNGVISRSGNWATSTYSSTSKGAVLFGSATTSQIPVGITDSTGTFEVSVTVWGF